MSELRIGEKVSVPAGYITKVISILAMRGAGKTYAAGVLSEELLDYILKNKNNNANLIIIDPVANVIASLLKLKVKPQFIAERKQFRKYISTVNYNANGLWAECTKNDGIFWLSSDHATNPKIDMCNSILHELLHMKYPDMRESKIQKKADNLVYTGPHNDDRETEKKKFDVAH